MREAVELVPDERLPIPELRGGNELALLQAIMEQIVGSIQIGLRRDSTAWSSIGIVVVGKPFQGNPTNLMADRTDAKEYRFFDEGRWELEAWHFPELRFGIGYRDEYKKAISFKGSDESASFSLPQTQVGAVIACDGSRFWIPVPRLSAQLQSSFAQRLSRT